MSEPGGSVLVVDVGTSGVRAAIVRPDATVEHVHHAHVLPDTPGPGLVEFDAAHMADAALTVAVNALAEGGAVDAVGIANQRASSIVWERATGKPVAGSSQEGARNAAARLQRPSGASRSPSVPRLAPRRDDRAR